MKHIIFFLVLLISSFSVAQEDEWIKTEGEIVEITIHTGKRIRESATIKYTLENGEEQFGVTDLFRIPFLGSFKAAGDKITINYKKSNPVLVETIVGKFLSTYGMYILIVLGLIFSVKPFLKKFNQPA